VNNAINHKAIQMGSHIPVVSYRNRKTLQNIEDPEEFAYRNGLSLLELQVILHFQSGNKWHTSGSIYGIVYPGENCLSIRKVHKLLYVKDHLESTLHGYTISAHSSTSHQIEFRKIAIPTFETLVQYHKHSNCSKSPHQRFHYLQIL